MTVKAVHSRPAALAKTACNRQGRVRSSGGNRMRSRITGKSRHHYQNFARACRMELLGEPTCSSGEMRAVQHTGCVSWDALLAVRRRYKGWTD